MLLINHASSKAKVKPIAAYRDDVTPERTVRYQSYPATLLSLFNDAMNDRPTRHDRGCRNGTPAAGIAFCMKYHSVSCLEADLSRRVLLPLEITTVSARDEHFLWLREADFRPATDRRANHDAIIKKLLFNYCKKFCFIRVPLRVMCTVPTKTTLHQLAYLIN